MSGLSYKLRMRQSLIVAIGGTIIVLLVALGSAYLFGWDKNKWALLLLGTFVFAASFALWWLWWKRLDDFQKQGHMASWYWGGMAGAAALTIWLGANGVQHTDFGKGALSMYFVQLAGFLLYYAYWWLRGRAGSQE